jgi:hypothetical protein
MTAALFIAFLALVVVVIVAPIARYHGERTAVRSLAGLCVWFIYAGLLGYRGVLKNTTIRPPGIAFLFVPILLFLFFSSCLSCDPRLVFVSR